MNQLGHLGGVSGRGLVDNKERGGAAIEFGATGVVLNTHAYIGHIPQAHLSGIGGGAQDGIAKLLGGLQTTLGLNGVFKLLVRQGWALTQFTGRDNQVLALQGAENIADGDIQRFHLGWLQPDSHTVRLLTHDLYITDPV